MDPTIPTTPTPKPTPTPEPKLEAAPVPMMGMESAFEKSPDLPPQPVAVQPNIPTPTPTPAPNPEPVKSMPTFTNSQPTISATEPITERDPLPEPDPIAEALKAPIKPVAPVPGSIGSAISVPDKAPSAQPAPAPADDPTPTSTPQPSEPKARSVSFDSPMERTESIANSASSTKPKKSSKSTMILLIILGAIIIASLVVILIMQLTSGNNSSAAAPGDQPTTVIEYATLYCEKNLSDAELLGYGNAVSGKEALVADYRDNKLARIESGFTIEYENAANASLGKEKFNSDYVAYFKKLGFSVDPFTSEYKVNENTIDVSHKANFEDIDETNMAIFNLALGKDNVIDTSKEAIQEIQTYRGLTCTVE